MKPEEVAFTGNVLTAEMCDKMHAMLGEGADYQRCAAAASTTLLFHIFRLGLHISKEHALEVLRSVLADVAVNLKTFSNLDLQVEVKLK